MRLAPLYEQDREAAIQKEASKLVLRLLNRRFGELPPHITETIQKLSVEKLEDLGEALLDFNIQADLINWLNQA
jgi:hypothetical protein